MKIGIIGNGFVGKATRQLQCKDIEVLCYDINPDLCDPHNLTLDQLTKECKIIFISVPTPMNQDGSCYINIVNSVVKQLRYLDYSGFIIIRSTVPVGTTDSLNCYFMPEFLTEKNYINDFINNKQWIFGIPDNKPDYEFKELISHLINLSYQNNKIKYNNIYFLSAKEAEMVKLYRNCFLATKISFCNEMFEFCDKMNINYENVRNIATLDSRIGSSHSLVPGHDGKRGFGGTCFPKDIHSLIYQMKKNNVDSYILKAVNERNEHVDRCEKDWTNNKGRTVI